MSHQTSTKISLPTLPRRESWSPSSSSSVHQTRPTGSIPFEGDAYPSSSQQPPRKRQRSQASLQRTPSISGSFEHLTRQVQHVDHLFELEEQLLAMLRIGSFTELQERAKSALVRAVLACPDQSLVDSVEQTFHTYELWCISRSIPQYPVTGLKVALFLSQHLGRPLSPTSQQSRIPLPPAYLQELAFTPGDRACLSVLTQWLSDLQSCCAATSACFGSAGEFVTVENLGANIGVRLVLEEARRVEAEELRKQLRGEGHRISWVSSIGAAPISQSLFRSPSTTTPLVGVARGPHPAGVGTGTSVSPSTTIPLEHGSLPPISTLFSHRFQSAPVHPSDYGRIENVTLPPISNPQFLLPPTPSASVTPCGLSIPFKAPPLPRIIPAFEFQPLTPQYQTSAVRRERDRTPDSPSPLPLDISRRSADVRGTVDTISRPLLSPRPGEGSPDLLTLPSPIIRGQDPVEDVQPEAIARKGPVGFMTLLNHFVDGKEGDR